MKLWPASPHPQWGMSRATIELQEVKLNDDKQPTYGQPLRLPCDSPTALITDLMKQLLFKGRKLNRELQQELYNSSNQTEQSRSDPSQQVELETLLLQKFTNQKLSKTRIYTRLIEMGREFEKSLLYQTLVALVDKGKISKEKAIHSASNNEYYLAVT